MSCNLLHVSGWRDFTDDSISEWTCGGGGQVDTTWSHRRPAETGIMSALCYVYMVQMEGNQSVRMEIQGGGRGALALPLFRRGSRAPHLVYAQCSNTLISAINQCRAA